MATTSFIYHAHGLHDHRLLKTEFHGGATYFHVELKAEKRACRGCGARHHELAFEGTFERTFRSLPVGRRATFIVLHGHEQRCGCCGRVLREPISFAEGKRQFTRRLARYIVELCGIATIKHVASFLGMGWDVVKEVFKESLRKQLKKRSLREVEHIAIDEFAVQKGHRYMTVVLDLDSGEILYAHEGKDADAVIPFLKKLRRSGAKLQAVAIDMSDAYLKAVREVFPAVDIVHDGFHVVALANKAVDETRREMCRELEGEEKQVIKGSRYLLLTGYENLTDERAERLDKLLELNEPLFRAHLLKEDLRAFWSLPDEETGEIFLDCWIETALSSGLRYFETLAQTIERHRSRLVTYFRHLISTGPLEGLNNKIKVLKRQAYGFRDMEYFRLRLYTIHESTPAFPG